MVENESIRMATRSPRALLSSDTKEIFLILDDRGFSTSFNSCWYSQEQMYVCSRTKAKREFSHMGIAWKKQLRASRTRTLPE